MYFEELYLGTAVSNRVKIGFIAVLFILIALGVFEFSYKPQLLAAKDAEIVCLGKSCKTAGEWRKLRQHSDAVLHAMEATWAELAACKADVDCNIIKVIGPCSDYSAINKNAASDRYEEWRRQSDEWLELTRPSIVHCPIPKPVKPGAVCKFNKCTVIDMAPKDIGDSAKLR